MPARFRWTRGDCYRNALRYLMEVERSGVLVHGVAMVATAGCGEMGGHAWVERDGLCLDQWTQSDAGPIPADDYYRLHGARPQVRYAVAEACARLVESGHWGPWHN